MFLCRNVGKDINCYLSINCIFQSPNVPQSYLGELMKPLVLIRPWVHADQVDAVQLLVQTLVISRLNKNPFKTSRPSLKRLQVQLLSLWIGNIKFSKAVHQACDYISFLKCCFYARIAFKKMIFRARPANAHASQRANSAIIAAAVAQWLYRLAIGSFIQEAGLFHHVSHCAFSHL